MIVIPPARPRRLLGAGLLAVVALGLAWSRLITVDSSWWLARDDAVITFSHARNLVDFGTIGVSPGDRVEGFSSPLQFLLAAGLLAIGDLGFQTSSLIIIVSCLAAIGALSFLFFDGVAKRSMFTPPGAAAIAAMTSLVFLVGTTSHWTVVGWVASGMENAPALAMLLATAASFPLLRRQGLWPAIPSLLLGLVAIARVDFAAFIVPLVALSVVELGRPIERNGSPVPSSGVRPRPRWVRLASGLTPALLLIVGVHVLRRLYFGTWLTNTAVVQNRFDGASQIILLVLSSAAVTFAVLLGPMRSPRWLRRLVGVLAALTALTYAWMARSGETAVPLRALLALPKDFPGLTIIIVVALALTVVESRVGRPDRSTRALLWALLFVPIGQFMIMGPARLETFRVLSMALPIALLWLGVVVIGLAAVAKEVDRASDTRRASAPAITRVAWMLFLVVGSAGLVLDHPRDLPWSIAGYARIQQVAEQFRNADLAPTSLPIVANPDLGKLSFQKEMLMVDLGWLGEPLLTALWNDDHRLAIDYLERIAMPDVLELHGWWSCTYNELFTPGFLRTYRPADERPSEEPESYADCPFEGRTIIWEREADDEHSLTRRLAEDPDPEALIAAALAACSASGDDPLRCQPVRRAVQRSILDLQRAGEWDAAIDLFSSSPTARLDRELLRRDPGWAPRAAAEVRSLLGGR